MIQVLEFIFSSPWRFLGSLVLLVVFTFWQPIVIQIGRDDKR